MYSDKTGQFKPVTNPAEATHLKIRLPGPTGTLMLPVQTSGTRAGTHNWSWNGRLDLPTLRPSLLTTGKYPLDYPGHHPLEDFRCHVWVNDGQVQFLDDTTHELRGQTLPLLDPDQDGAD